MKYKLVYANQWGYKHAKTIKAESLEEAIAKATEFVRTTEYDYMTIVSGHSEIVSITPIAEEAK